ncbi:MAG: radical SAM protein [Planctomycetes bacterium]|nr:radical SAM protein [Planctomycetota bacterium]
MLERIARQTTLVVDTTLQCNMRCVYCRWGDGATRKDSHRAPRDLVLDGALLREAGIDRVVFSGGEPLLHPHLFQVIENYAALCVRSIVVITNGLLASREKLLAMQSAGATGIAFSLDSVAPEIAYRTRRLEAAQLSRVLDHLSVAGAMRSDAWEVSVNAVLSSANLHPTTLVDLANEVQHRGAGWLKFQPIFDDGYLGSSAPELRLEARHVESVIACGRALSMHSLLSNPTSFWEDLAAMLGGQQFSGSSCGLAGQSWALHRDGLMICPWIQAGTVGDGGLAAAMRRFVTESNGCRPGANCFCMQKPSHRWARSGSDAS